RRDCNLEWPDKGNHCTIWQLGMARQREPLHSLATLNGQIKETVAQSGKDFQRLKAEHE
ncbi:hypothetical protein SK128_000663, partial [Halocaridina rubra]